MMMVKFEISRSIRNGTSFYRDVATKIILQSHWSLTPNSKFSDGAKAIKQADALLYGGQHAADIDRIWAARGISTN